MSDDPITLGLDMLEFGFRFFTSPPIHPGCEFICSVSPDLGAVIQLRTLNGRVIAETESGIPMIVPAHAVVR